MATFAVGRLDFHALSGELRARADVRRLEPKAAAVLQILCEHSGEVVPRQDLLDRCWGNGEGSDEALTQAIAQIRRALEDLGEPGLIETLAKRGYRLNAGSTADSLAERAPPDRTAAKRFALPLLGIAAALLLIMLIANPHGPRHFLRHALGLGPATTH